MIFSIIIHTKKDFYFEHIYSGYVYYFYERRINFFSKARNKVIECFNFIKNYINLSRLERNNIVFYSDIISIYNHENRFKYYI